MNVFPMMRLIMFIIMRVINYFFIGLLSISTLNCATKKQKVVFVDALQEIYYEDRLFKYNEAVWQKARQEFAKEGMLLTTDRKYLNASLDCYILFNAPCSEHSVKIMDYKKVKKILMAWEPPAVDPRNYCVDVWRQFNRVMTFHDDVIKRCKFKRFNYCFPLALPKDIIGVTQKKLCVLVASNKTSMVPGESIYALRSKIVDFFINNAPEDFDLWGPRWKKSCVYRGIAGDKRSCLAHYKFAFCFENSCVPGYITEKIFDAFSAGCVPIYLGAPNICNSIPKSCFIDYRDFLSLNELYNYLKNMSDEEYENYLKEARHFLQSTKSYPFSYDSFIKQLLNTVKEVLAG